MQNLAIIQARMSSSRLPGKVLKEINGIPAIKFQIDRVAESCIDSIVVATSTDPSDDILVSYLNEINVPVRRGALNDVASRFEQVLGEYQPVNFLRLTADCPFVMPKLIDEMVDKFAKEKIDYLCNTNPPTYPDGLDVEIVRTAAFKELTRRALSESEREHVTLAFRRFSDQYSVNNFANVEDLSELRWTIDYPQDLEFLRAIAELLAGREREFSLPDVLSILRANPQIQNTFGHEYRNIAITKSSKLGDHHE